MDGLRDGQALAEVVVDGWEDVPAPLNHAAVLLGTGCHAIVHNCIATAYVGSKMTGEVGSQVALCRPVGKHVDLDVAIFWLVPFCPFGCGQGGPTLVPCDVDADDAFEPSRVVPYRRWVRRGILAAGLGNCSWVWKLDTKSGALFCCP